MKKTFYILLFSVLLLLACNSDNPTVPTLDYDPEVNIFGLLILNRQQKTIRIEESYKVTDYFPEFRGVPDAEVWVRTKNQNVHFQHLFNGNYSDKQNALKLIIGETYMLDVTMADGKRITAECIMPGPPHILSPNTNEAAPAYSALDVFWEPGEQAYRYQLAVYDDFRNFKFSSYSDSTYAQLFPFIFAPERRYTLKIASLDKNYWDYLRSRSNRQPIQTIDGALGVFGAIAYDTVVFYALWEGAP